MHAWWSRSAARDRFLQAAFGATELMRLADPRGNIVHAEIEIGDSPIDHRSEQGRTTIAAPNRWGDRRRSHRPVCRRCRRIRRASHRRGREGDFPDLPIGSTATAPADCRIRSGICGSSPRTRRTSAGRDDASHGSLDAEDAKRRATEEICERAGPAARGVSQHHPVSAGRTGPRG